MLDLLFRLVPSVLGGAVAVRVQQAGRHEMSKAIPMNVESMEDSIGKSLADQADEIARLRAALAEAEQEVEKLCEQITIEGIVHDSNRAVVEFPQLVRHALDMEKRSQAAESTASALKAEVERLTREHEQWCRQFVADAERAASALRERVPDDLRDAGWAVAVHNDYRQAGEPHTFWLFTKDGRAVKGEGRTDSEALDEIRAALRAEHRGASRE